MLFVSMMERTVTGSVGFITRLFIESMLNEKSETNISYQNVASLPDQVCNPIARRSHSPPIDSTGRFRFVSFRAQESVTVASGIWHVHLMCSDLWNLSCYRSLF